MLILLLHLMWGRSTYNHAQVIFVVVTLCLVILHLEQIIVLLLGIAIVVRNHGLPLLLHWLLLLLLLLLNHVKALALCA